MTNDPFPYVGQWGSRHAYPGTLNGLPLEFDPRPEYDQNMNVLQKRVVEEVLQENEGLVGTHWETCYRHHAACLARILTNLES